MSDEIKKPEELSVRGLGLSGRIAFRTIAFLPARLL
jgi:hypothetical protein